MRQTIAPVLALMLFGTQAHAQTSVLLSPTEDASLGYHDNFNSANTNYNSTIHYSAFAQPGAQGGVNKARGAMDFDLTNIPAGSTILGAFLTLSGIGPFGSPGAVSTVGHVGPNECTLRRINSAWADNTVTWNSQPTSTTQNEVLLDPSTYATENYLNINVTTLVQDMIDDPANSHGFMLQLVNETTSRGLAFHSSLAPDADKRPVLLVIYGDCWGEGIADPGGEEHAFTISPNSTSPGATVRLDPDFAPNTPCEVSLIDAIGQTVKTEQMRQWPYDLIVPAVAQGIYTVRLASRDGNVLGTAPLVVR
ncbi:MAG: DNRLRE domain-containing protein [Flavobacteriales bacterium]|nr:DNRLRE domain-containing protein [Flavobacteriales bacterium]